MNYIKTTLATNWTEKDLNSWNMKLINILFFFVPRANKDNEKIYHLVKSWWLEIDENGVPIREIGMDKNEKPLFTSPNDRNYGLWTDSSTTFDVKEFKQIDKNKFNKIWKTIKT